MPAGEPPPGTPLAPSVEKAYYRKCIQLKRRLNEVESANDDLKIRRMRLDRSIMKMRLERAFLLDELRKRAEPNIDGSDGSGDEGMQTPPPDRPYRDKRRRQQSSSHGQGAAAPSNTFQHVQYAPPGADGRFAYVDPAPARTLPSQGSAPALPHGSPYGPPPTGIPSGTSQANGEAGGETAEGVKDAQENGDRSAEVEATRGGGGFSAINS
ncbi:hypothetical protein CB0940_08280 [Cercospora beticola]|uniref:INO80 complex subunit F domain-containing protein n=1 Tax=Cercospora beticola TaxID=122368 RepID=A0A2G5HQW3_CERBT|nr:hypothetical protein CB0940_08280 [Cercospora beticola]PIA94936.1 hypothetical protein CB0940_08280 [Cercospora beticola]WPB04849.1 hypothetical protein RHO25_009496 [Cercospora beticola]